MNDSKDRNQIGRGWCIALLSSLLGGAVLALSPEAPDPERGQSAEALESIVVTGKRLPDPVADMELVERVEAVLHDDPYLYDGHITIRVKNGVAILEGLVFDELDVRRALRLARRTAGVKRVVNRLEIQNSNFDEL